MRFLLLFGFLFLHTNLYAQMDEKFYFPSENWIEFDSIKYDFFSQKVEKDTITSYLLYPKSQKVKATILYFHGNGGNVSSYIKYVKPLLEDGFQVFMVDFRGYGKSTGKPTHTNILSDGQLFFDFALKQKALQSQKIIICGVSIGSQIATHLARQNETKISALIIDSGISSLIDIALSYVPKQNHEQVKKTFKVSYSSKEDIKFLKTINVLFIHSKSDSVVPFNHYEAVKKNCTTLNSSLIYDGEHIVFPILFPQKYIKAVNQLLE